MPRFSRYLTIFGDFSVCQSPGILRVETSKISSLALHMNDQVHKAVSKLRNCSKTWPSKVL